MREPSEMQKPEWAVAFVRGALRTGMNVLEIEQHLVSKGLSPEDAKSIVMDCVEAAFVESAEPIGSSEWGKPVRLLVSAVIAGACVGLAYWRGGGPSVGVSLIWVVPALLATWLPELPDLEGSEWAARLAVSGWGLLLICLCYRVFILAIWP